MSRLIATLIVLALVAPTVARAQDVPPPPPGDVAPPPPPGDVVPPPPLGDIVPPPPAGDVVPQPPPGYSSVPVPPASGYAPPAAIAVEPAPSPPPSDRRSAGEMVELYVTASLWGIFTGGWILSLSGEPDDSLYGTLPLLLGAATALSVYALDSGDGLPRGAGAAISAGAWLGLFEGLWIVLAYRSHLDVGDTAGTMIWGASAAGLGLGFAIGYGLRPEVRHSRLVESAALWGASFGGVLALMTQPDDPDVSFQMVLAGYNVGIIGAALAAGPLDLPGLRVLWLNLGFLGGVLVGSMVPTIASGRRGGDVDERAIGAGLGIGMLAGLILTWLITIPSEPQTPEPPRVASVLDSLVPFASPTEHGGVLAGAAGRF